MDKRPVLHIPYSIAEIIIEGGSILGLLFTVVLLATNWHVLPSSIPTHFGLNGQPDGWGGKGSLLFLPIVCLFMYVGFTVMQRYPHIYNYPIALTPDNVEKLYHIGRVAVSLIKIELVWTFGLMTWQTISVAYGRTPISGWLLMSIAILQLLTVAGCIYRMYKTR